MLNVKFHYSHLKFRQTNISFRTGKLFKMIGKMHLDLLKIIGVNFGYLRELIFEIRKALYSIPNSGLQLYIMRIFCQGMGFMDYCAESPARPL